ncbi:MAG: aminopeptidase [Chloroflexi bacterium]|nr:aminopeptidase [Chloroflexota bacterium]
MDPRWAQVADVLVGHSTALRAGERVMIAMGGLACAPLTHALYEACIKAGALPQVQYLSGELRRALLLHGDERQLAWTPEIESYGMDWADVYLGLRGGGPLDDGGAIPAAARSAQQAAQGAISALRWQKTRWCLVRVPDETLARGAGIDVNTLRDMFFAGCLLDYQTAGVAWRAAAEKLRGARSVRIVAGEETDLSFSVAGRSWVVCAGKINLPDGEVYTAPITDTVSGRIHFELPASLGGVEMRDIRLEWEAGELVAASASSNEGFLQRILRTDAGASLLGEFAFGLNPGISHFCGDILYDEKIRGTVHIALGRAYRDCGGINQSRIHWDLVKDLRAGGAVYVDDNPVLQDGELLI